MNNNNPIKNPLLHLIGYYMDEEKIAGMTYSETKDYVGTTYQKVSGFVKEKFEQFEIEHPNWQTELKEGSKELWDTTLHSLKEEKEALKGKIIQYYYENREQKKEESSS